MNTIIDDYLWTVDTGSANDNQELYRACLEAEETLKTLFPLNPNDIDFYGSYTASKFREYNIFTFPDKHLIKLYYSLVDNISPILDKNRSYMIQAWINIFPTGGFIQWHGHWPSQWQVFHGYYCVSAENSTTSYRMQNDPTIYPVHNKNGLLVIGRSGEDQHTSSPNLQPTSRITLAFDIVPVENVESKSNINHYIPFRA